MREMTDREAYPAAWITVGTLAAAFIVWKYGLGAPTISSCWVWNHWHIYCPGCGGTRAVIALIHGEILKAFWYHPAVPVIVGLGGVYLVSQTIWRLRGCRGWTLHYNPRWPVWLAALFLVNCVVRNVLWLCFGIGL